MKQAHTFFETHTYYLFLWISDRTHTCEFREHTTTKTFSLTTWYLVLWLLVWLSIYISLGLGYINILPYNYIHIGCAHCMVYLWKEVLSRVFFYLGRTASICARTDTQISNQRRSEISIKWLRRQILLQIRLNAAWARRSLAIPGPISGRLECCVLPQRVFSLSLSGAAAIPMKAFSVVYFANRDQK